MTVTRIKNEIDRIVESQSRRRGARVFRARRQHVSPELCPRFIHRPRSLASVCISRLVRLVRYLNCFEVNTSPRVPCDRDDSGVRITPGRTSGWRRLAGRILHLRRGARSVSRLSLPPAATGESSLKLDECGIAGWQSAPPSPRLGSVPAGWLSFHATERTFPHPLS